jgi:hypothetical protein
MNIVNYLNIEISETEIKENVNFECNELFIHSLNKRKVGAGHYELSLDLEIDGKHNYYKRVTTNMGIIDDMTEDDDMISDEAIKRAVFFVLNEIELENEEF